MNQLYSGDNSHKQYKSQVGQGLVFGSAEPAVTLVRAGSGCPDNENSHALEESNPSSGTGYNAATRGCGSTNNVGAPRYLVQDFAQFIQPTKDD